MFRNVLSNPLTLKLLLILNIILFTEIITILFLFFPTFLLSYTIFILLFYLLFSIFFLSSLFIPWLSMFFNTNPNYIYLTLGISTTCFIVYLISHSYIKFPLQIIIYFILLKSFMSGLALFFKVITSNFLQNGSEKVSFSFSNGSSASPRIQKIPLQNSKKFELIGALLFLVVYPFGIIFLVQYLF